MAQLCIDASVGVAVSGLFVDHLDSPVGRLSLVGSDAGVRAITWPDDRAGRVRLPDLTCARHPVLEELATRLTAYFAGERDDFDVGVDLWGTAFQVEVWNALCAIPYGSTVTYGGLARQLGRPNAGRAVGAAVGRNPVSIVIPCHRAVGSDGSLTGFAGGLAAKAWLLRHEGVHPMPNSETTPAARIASSSSATAKVVAGRIR